VTTILYVKILIKGRLRLTKHRAVKTYVLLN